MYYRFFKSLSVLLIVISHTYIGSMHNTPHFIATSNGAIYKNYQSIPQNSPSAVLPVVEEKKELRCLCCCPSISDSCTDQARKKCYRLMLLGCFVWIRPGAGHN